VLEEPVLEEAEREEPELDEQEAPAENGAGDEDWGYTPMSEWGLDEK
jgi:hypothetical protein